MQNIGSKDKTTDIKTTSDEIKLDSDTAIVTTCTTKSAEGAGETFQSEPESSPKVKNRSRFSAAIHKISKSTRKKQNPTLQKQEPIVAAVELVTSSGADEPGKDEITAPTAEGEKPSKKRSKLSKRFLLSGLKKSKSIAKQSIEIESPKHIHDIDEKQPTTETVTKPPIEQSPSPSKDTRPSLVADLVASGSLQQLDKKRTIQITLSSKKIEHTRSIDNVTTKLAPRATCEIGSIDKDYLAPKTVETEQSIQLEESKSKQPILITYKSLSEEKEPTLSPKNAVTDLSVKSKKKKNKSKKITTLSSVTAQTATDTPTTTTTGAVSTKTAPAATTIPTTSPIAASTRTPPTEEKFVITQCKRDTPPRECAPAKPSRIVVAVSSTSQSSASTGAIRKPIGHTSTTESTQVDHKQKISEQQHSSQVHSVVKQESADLMNDPQSEIESGQQSTQPIEAIVPISTTSIEQQSASIVSDNNNDDELPTATASTTIITATITNPQQRQRQIKYQSQSLATTTETETSPEHKLSSSPQEPNYPPPSIPSNTATTASILETRSSPTLQHHRRSPLPSEQFYLATRILPNESSSVASAHNSDLDEAISSADSAQQQDIELYLSVQDRLSQESQRTIKPDDSFDSTKSSRSQSPISESSRRRIRYVAQPTITDEIEQVETRREALSYLYSAVSDYSVESDFESNKTFDQDDPSMPAFGDLTMDQEEPPIMTSSAEKREHLYKILVIGELGTGKTSFIKRYVHQFFSQNYRATIGVDFALKVLHWDANTIVRLQLWDIAGQERFGNMTRVYYKEAVGAFIVFDVTRSGTFDCVSKWKEDLDSKVQLPDGSPIPCILLANKCDQDKQGIVTTPEKMDEYVKENGFAGWFETSAKENINIDEAARALVNKILLNDKLISAADLADSEKFNLNSSAEETVSESKSKCSC